MLYLIGLTTLAARGRCFLVAILAVYLRPGSLLVCFTSPPLSARGVLLYQSAHTRLQAGSGKMTDWLHAHFLTAFSRFFK